MAPGGIGRRPDESHIGYSATLPPFSITAGLRLIEKNYSPSLTSGHVRTAVAVRYSTRAAPATRIDLARRTINFCTAEFLCGGRPVRHSQREKNGPDKPPSSSPKPEGPTIPFSHRLSCTIDEACEATGLGRTKLYELIGAGQVATTTVGRRRLVMVRGLLSYLEANKST